MILIELAAGGEIISLHLKSNVFRPPKKSYFRKNLMFLFFIFHVENIPKEISTKNFSMYLLREQCIRLKKNLVFNLVCTLRKKP